MLKANVSGEWKDAVPYTKINNEWKPITSAYQKYMGVWKPIFYKSSVDGVTSIVTKIKTIDLSLNLEQYGPILSNARFNDEFVTDMIPYYNDVANEYYVYGIYYFRKESITSTLKRSIVFLSNIKSGTASAYQLDVSSSWQKDPARITRYDSETMTIYLPQSENSSTYYKGEHQINPFKCTSDYWPTVGQDFDINKHLSFTENIEGCVYEIINEGKQIVKKKNGITVWQKNAYEYVNLSSDEDRDNVTATSITVDGDLCVYIVLKYNNVNYLTKLKQS